MIFNTCFKQIVLAIILNMHIHGTMQCDKTVPYYTYNLQSTNELWTACNSTEKIVSEIIDYHWTLNPAFTIKLGFLCIQIEQNVFSMLKEWTLWGDTHFGGHF